VPRSCQIEEQAELSTVKAIVTYTNAFVAQLLEKLRPQHHGVAMPPGRSDVQAPRVEHLDCPMHTTVRVPIHKPGPLEQKLGGQLASPEVGILGGWIADGAAGGR